MKLLILTTLFSLILAPSLRPQDAIPTGGSPEVPAPELQAENSLGVTDQQLEFVLQEAGVKEKFEACKAMFSSSKINNDVSECLWNGKIKDPDDPEGMKTKIDLESPAKLSSDERDSVAAKIENLNPAAQAGVNKDKFESLDTGFLEEVNRDPAFKKINDLMVKKLNETIYGEERAGKLKMADHMVFHDLYKSQLSKNVIQAMSSYCLDAEADAEKYFIATDIPAERKKNIDRLKDPAIKEPENMTWAQFHFTTCIRSLRHLCYMTGNYSDYELTKEKVDALKAEIPELEGDLKNASPDVDTNKIATEVREKREKLDNHKGIKRSQTRACNVVTYIKQLKQNIIALEKIQNRMDELGLKDKGPRLSTGDQNHQQEVETYVGEKNELITSISSKEFIEDSGFKEAVEAQKKDFQNCMDDSGSVDPEACKKYLNDDREEAKRLLAEADLRSRGMEKRIEDNVKDEKGVQIYLTDQGYTNEQIEEMTSNPDAMNSIKNQISSRYSAERKAYIESIKKRLSQKTVEDNKGISGVAGTDAVDKLQEIKQGLASKTERYTELVHFNNIVSGFLQTDDGQGNTGSNTTGLALELGGSAYGSNGRDTASAGTGHLEEVKAAIEAAGINAEIKENSNNTLQQGEINDVILEYDR